MSIAEPADAPAAEAETAVGAEFNIASAGQIYETIIRADDVPLMRFVSIPRQALGLESTDSAEKCLQILGLDGFERQQFFPADLPWTLWDCLTSQRDYPSEDRAAWSPEDRRLVEYAEYLAFEELIPFELSPQKSHSLGKLMISGATMGAALGAGAAGAKAGAAGGFIIGAPGGPLVFITTPVGFVVGGLVGAVTGALGERLYGRLRQPKLKARPSKPKPGTHRYKL